MVGTARFSIVSHTARPRISAVFYRDQKAMMCTASLRRIACSTAMVVLLLPCFHAVEPPPSPPPPLTPNFKCANTLDCELNGSCNDDGCCECIDGWTGPSCGTLDLLPANFAGSWPVIRPVPPEWWGEGNTPGGWGGSILKSDDGNYHMIAASGCYIPQRVMHMDGNISLSWLSIHSAVELLYQGRTNAFKAEPMFCCQSVDGSTFGSHTVKVSTLQA